MEPGRMDGCVVVACERCPGLVSSRSQIVNGVGPEDADLLIVGEAPGRDEDAAGEPFVGRSGAILTRKLRENGLSRDRVRITNCVRCRPPDNRDPSAEELENCRAYLEREIDLVDPTLIVAVGKVPSEHLIGRQVTVTREAGHVEEVTIGRRRRAILVSPHPAAMLYDRSLETLLDESIATAASIVGGAGGDADPQTGLDDFSPS